MSNVKLQLRCYAERKHGVWQAFCIDYDLAAQADTLEQVKRKLALQILEYLYDALEGQDRAHAEYLFARKSPLHMRAKWHFYGLLQHIDGFRNRIRAFLEPLPLRVQNRKFAC